MPNAKCLTVNAKLENVSKHIGKTDRNVQLRLLSFHGDRQAELLHLQRWTQAAYKFVDKEVSQLGFRTQSQRSSPMYLFPTAEYRVIQNYFKELADKTRSDADVRLASELVRTLIHFLSFDC